MFAGGAPLISAWVLALGGGLCGLAGSTAYVVLVATDSYSPGAWNNALLMVAYASPGIAALLPDMRQLTEPGPGGSDLSMSRWTLLAAALVTTTATTGLTATRMSTAEVIVAALPVPLVVLWRLRRVLLAKEEAVASAERASRQHQLLARLGALAVSSDIITLRQEARTALADEASAEMRLVPGEGAPADAAGSRPWTEDEDYLAESVATVAHDLKNPLTAVSMNAEVLSCDMADLPSAGRDAVAAISRATQRMDQRQDVVRCTSPTPSCP